MDPNNVVGTPNMQTQSVAPVAPVAPVGQPEPNPMVAAIPEKKSSKGGVIAAILFAVLAAGGIGFGVYTMLNSKTQEDKLNEQITTLRKQNAELMNQIAEGGDSSSDTTINTEDYIYVGEWGVKFKISDNLQYVSYSIDSFDNEWVSGTSLCVSAATAGHDDNKPSFIKTNGGSHPYSLGCLTKYTRAETEVIGIGEVTIGEYYFEGPQDLIGDEADRDWEVESRSAIRAMLSTDNMSAI